ncbi:MAG: GAF domain-containing sensor histidine kinase [Anaerolineales bacterium]|nr:GAF domain-containing sensor histidine kinase [Anaerolineales bacterium]
MAVDQDILLSRLIELTRGFSTMVDLEPYLQSILSAASELTESESASLLEYDEVSQEFSFKFAPWFHRAAISSAKVPLYGSIAGWVFLQKKPLAIDDVTKDDRHYKAIDDISGFTTRSILCAPLVVHGKPVGVIEIFNKKDSYTGQDILILETLASLAANALQNDMLEKKVLSSQDETRKLDELKSEFIAITSHELRTPLGLILGHSTFLKELIGSEYKEQVDSIIRNASRLKDIIESLSSVYNYETGGSLVRSHMVSVGRVIEDVSASFHDMAKKKDIVLNIEVERNNELWVDIDSGKIAIVLSNLLKNALTFTNEGGQVTIRGEQQVECIKVSVEDNGLGIPAKDLPLVFDRFYQVESHLTRRHGGMGLGLSIAKVMIEMHGGDLWVESTEGVGSKFTFLLPVKQKSKLEVPPQPFVE